MKIVWLPGAWEDYLHWQDNDKKTLRKINGLIRAIQGNPFTGIGKPEALRFDLSGWWSRRITQKERLVYRIEGDALVILQCRYHYKEGG